jgi:hypothetical protein
MKRKRKHLHVVSVVAAMKRKKRLHGPAALHVPAVVRGMKSLKMTSLKMMKRKRKKPLGARGAAPVQLQRVAVHVAAGTKRKKSLKRKKSALHVVQGALQQLQQPHAADHRRDQGRTRTTILKLALPLVFE